MRSDTEDSRRHAQAGARPFLGLWALLLLATPVLCAGGPSQE
jgi:hypothetical protein